DGFLADAVDITVTPSIASFAATAARSSADHAAPGPVVSVIDRALVGAPQEIEALNRWPAGHRACDTVAQALDDLGDAGVLYLSGHGSLISSVSEPGPHVVPVSVNELAGLRLPP